MLNKHLDRSLTLATYLGVCLALYLGCSQAIPRLALALPSDQVRAKEKSHPEEIRCGYCHMTQLESGEAVDFQSTADGSRWHESCAQESERTLQQSDLHRISIIEEGLKSTDPNTLSATFRRLLESETLNAHVLHLIRSASETILNSSYPTEQKVEHSLSGQEWVKNPVRELFAATFQMILRRHESGGRVSDQEWEGFEKIFLADSYNRNKLINLQIKVITGEVKQGRLLSDEMWGKLFRMIHGRYRQKELELKLRLLVYPTLELFTSMIVGKHSQLKQVQGEFATFLGTQIKRLSNKRATVIAQMIKGTELVAPEIYFNAVEKFRSYSAKLSPLTRLHLAGAIIAMEPGFPEPEAVKYLESYVLSWSEKRQIAALEGLGFLTQLNDYQNRLLIDAQESPKADVVAAAEAAFERSRKKCENSLTRELSGFIRIIPKN